MKIPDKCKYCEHAIVQLENVHDGWCKFHLDSVVRCDCFQARYKVGCVCAEMYCKKRTLPESDPEGSQGSRMGSQGSESEEQV